MASLKAGCNMKLGKVIEFIERLDQSVPSHPKSVVTTLV